MLAIWEGMSNTETTTQIVTTYTDEHGLHEVSAESLPALARVFEEMGYEGDHLRAYEGETLRGWVGADGWYRFHA